MPMHLPMFTDCVRVSKVLALLQQVRARRLLPVHTGTSCVYFRGTAIRGSQPCLRIGQHFPPNAFIRDMPRHRDQEWVDGCCSIAKVVPKLPRIGAVCANLLALVHRTFAVDIGWPTKLLRQCFPGSHHRHMSLASVYTYHWRKAVNLHSTGHRSIRMSKKEGRSLIGHYRSLFF